MPHFNIAEMNVASMRYPVRDPRMADFFGAIDQVNANADAAPGFLWRMPEYLEQSDAIEVIRHLETLAYQGKVLLTPVKR